MILETQNKSSSYEFGWNLARAIALPHDYRRKLHGLTSVVQLKMKMLLGLHLFLLSVHLYLFPMFATRSGTSLVDTGRKLNVHETFRRRPAQIKEKDA